jgi:hypothetical protein
MPASQAGRRRFDPGRPLQSSAPEYWLAPQAATDRRGVDSRICERFRAPTSSIQSSDMWLSRRDVTPRPWHRTSELPEGIQRLEREQAELRSRLDSELQLRILAAQIGGAAQIAPVTFMPESEKFEAYLEEYECHAAGGRARARVAERDERGRFLARASRSVLMIVQLF